MLEKTLRQLKIGIGILVIILLLGTFGYMLLEGWDFFDAFYMTIIAISTTGFQEVHYLSTSGRFLTIVIIVFGLTTIAYTGSRLAEFMIETKIFRRRRMSKKLDELSDHFIVCGYGRMGKSIVSKLSASKVDFVVIENNPETIDMLIDNNILFVNGNSTFDNILLKAGVKRAKGLVVVLSDDAENVFTTLSAKVLNPNIYVVARAIYDETESKLIRAGADKVVKPYEIGGAKMAELLLKPGVIETLEIFSEEKNLELNIKEFLVKKGSVLINKKIADMLKRDDLNVIIVSIYNRNGKNIYNPRSSDIIELGDELLVIGELVNLDKFSKLCSA
jgi:voltage-gated potassium channel